MFKAKTGTSYVVISLAGLVLAAFTVPILPCPLPEDEWEEAAFPEISAELYKVAHKLDQFEDQLRKEGGHLRSQYNLEAKFGHTNVRRSLLGSCRFGYSSHSTHGFGASGPLGIPYVIYDPEKHGMRATPQGLKGLMEWAEHADGYP